MPRFGLSHSLLVVFLLCACGIEGTPLAPTETHAEPWTGILPTTRGADWSLAGAGPIPTRDTICTTLGTAGQSRSFSQSVTATQINNAIQSCPANQVVKLNPGLYVLSGGITFNGKDNVTLRGSGPLLTTLDINGTGSCIWGAGVCLGMSMFWSGTANATPESQITNWTGNYTEGTTQLQLQSTSGLSPGMVIVLDQCDFPTPDDGGVLNSAIVPTFSNEGGPPGRHDTGTHSCPGGDNQRRTQQEYKFVVSVDSGTLVTITPPILTNMWSAGLDPEVWWWTTAQTTTAAGLEDMTIDLRSNGVQMGVEFGGCVRCWVRNIRLHGFNRAGIRNGQSAFNTFRDSYVYFGNSHASQAYALEHYGGGSFLAENNIYQNIVAAPLGPCSLCVNSYSFVIDSFLGTNSNMLSLFGSHQSGGSKYLFEGNQTDGFVSEEPHGNQPLTTLFRNHLRGFDYTSRSLSSNGTVFQLRSYSRGYSIIGNVLGYPTGHTVYQGTCSGDIYQIGGTCGRTVDDPYVAVTLLRWGNYDTVTDSTRFLASEVPTTSVPRLAGMSVPATTTLPASFYLTGKPTAWWNTPWGEPQWPPIGPDVTGGNHPDNSVSGGIGGHADMIPAYLCYRNTPQDTTYPLAVTHTDRGFLAFDANDCYLASSSTSPAAPTNVRVQ